MKTMKGRQRTIEHLVSTIVFDKTNTGNVFIVLTMTTLKLVEETITMHDGKLLDMTELCRLPLLENVT